MPHTVLTATNFKTNPIDSMRSIARSRKLQTTGRMHRFASFLNRPRAAGNLPAWTMSMNNRHEFPEFTLTIQQQCSRDRRFVTIRAISVVIGLLVWLVLSTAQIDAQTQAVMNAQARAEFERADAELNTTYQSVLAKLPTVESKQKLREAQRAWVVSRDAEAAQAAKEADGGSMAPTLRYGRMTRLTQERINELNNMVDHGTQNAGKLAASSATASPSSTPESTSEQAQSVSETGRSSSSSASSVSPEKKWEYIDGDTSQL